MGKSKGAINSLKSAATYMWLDSCETGCKFLPQRGNDTNESVRLHVIRHTSQLRHLLDATTNCEGRKAHGLKDRTLLRTDGVHHSDVALLDEVPIREWLHPASKDAGNIITGTHYLVGLSSLLAEELSCFLQVACLSIDGVFPLRRRHRPEV